jgi:hypothetical protein
MAPSRKGSSHGRVVHASRNLLIAAVSAVVLCTGLAGVARAATLCTGIKNTCREPGRSSLRIKNTSDHAQNRIAWKWLRGAATTVADFGTPTGTTQYALCIYTGTSSAEADIAPSSTLWAKDRNGFRYKDRALSSDGIRKVNLASGSAGKAKVVVTGKGANLPPLPTGPLTLPVTVQLVNNTNAVCFESVFTSADVKANQNTAALFKAKFPPR